MSSNMYSRKYEQNYNHISKWFFSHNKCLKIFRNVYRILPYLMVLCYGILVTFSFYEYIANDEKTKLVKIVLVPAITFLTCTLLRKVVNRRRPYEQYQIDPIIIKHKKGQSLPSRHVVSAFIIAMGGLYINIGYGVALFVLSLFIAIIRPIAGVHYISDVIAGIAMGILFGYIGFFII